MQKSAYEALTKSKEWLDSLICEILNTEEPSSQVCVIRRVEKKHFDEAVASGESKVFTVGEDSVLLKKSYFFIQRYDESTKPFSNEADQIIDERVMTAVGAYTREGWLLDALVEVIETGFTSDDERLLRVNYWIE